MYSKILIIPNFKYEAIQYELLEDINKNNY